MQFPRFLSQRYHAKVANRSTMSIDRYVSKLQLSPCCFMFLYNVRFSFILSKMTLTVCLCPCASPYSLQVGLIPSRATTATATGGKTEEGTKQGGEENHAHSGELTRGGRWFCLPVMLLWASMECPQQVGVQVLTLRSMTITVTVMLSVLYVAPGPQRNVVSSLFLHV